MSGYGQFCPVAKAMETLDERWTLLVVRELLAGSTRFNELRRGNPRMSPALLSKRLRTLVRAGLVRREVVGGQPSYTLTASGEDLREIVLALGVWGTRWIGGLGDRDLDPHLLMWDMRRTVPVDEWPRVRGRQLPVRRRTGPGGGLVDHHHPGPGGRLRLRSRVREDRCGEDQPAHAHRDLAR